MINRYHSKISNNWKRNFKVYSQVKITTFKNNKKTQINFINNTPHN